MNSTTQVAVFGGGCFWCTEAVFAELRGVESVIPGYAGGHKDNPTYYEVCSGTTGHAEVTKVEFDPSQIGYRDLLGVFFATHDPTSLDRQGADKGPQYHSVVLYTKDEQKAEAEASIRELEESTYKPGQIVTDILPLDKFYEAEDDHKDFYARNPGSMYCQIVISPKVQKVRKEFSSQLRQPE
jgi:peptide-methionine (S)-S-oxide reductase